MAGCTTMAPLAQAQGALWYFQTKKVNFRGCVYSRCFAAFIGPISSITVFGQPIIILNDARCAIEILEKRSATYSARPEQPFMEMYV